MWDIRFTHNAEKEKKLLKQAGLETKAKKLLNVLATKPYQNPPRDEKLTGDLLGYYSRRINIQHRMVYRIDEERHMVIIHAMRTPYEN